MPTPRPLRAGLVHRAFAAPGAVALAGATLDLLHARLAAPHGGFWDGASEDWQPHTALRRQNPHMHLLEALLAWHAATGEERWLNEARAIVRLFETRFFDPATGTLGEFSARLAPAQGHVVEPGHQFEWVWLLHRWRAQSGETGMAAAAEALYATALRHGFDPEHGGIHDQIHRTGAPLRDHAAHLAGDGGDQGASGAHRGGGGGGGGRARARPAPDALAHRAQAASSLTRLGGILLVADEDEAFAFAAEYAPEHLQLAVADPEAALARTGHAAEILLGQSTPMAAANFTAGVPNTLPSGGYAKVSSGITARTFLATSTVAALSPEALARATVPALRLAEHEGFPAHAAALRARGPAAPPPSRDG